MDRLRALRLFVQVVKARNFTAASSQLNISRSYLSREISALETALGVRLINRTTRHVSPTEVGRIYYERCAKLLNDLDEADFELAANHGEPRGHIRLLAPKSFMVFALPDAIVSFSKKYPDVEMTVLPFDRKIDLVQSGIDLALRFGDLSDSTLVCRNWRRSISRSARRRAILSSTDCREHPKICSPITVCGTPFIPTMRDGFSSQRMGPWRSRFRAV
ncbi:MULTISPECIES: LysR family transcriptional regulator [unclassified Beijerinckia]|uniref:LysR family transcriptional regulator n=1 Tax=unclassified Beijerinckia TaxID=2638183 RepID=UPI000B829812|nr:MULTISPECIES: LysR family transcriptional regulator [unclassified Beijerinckia]MDH7797944.1 DNA-binding transcriptional LysR family regulator [Beijerinckia sp. GAS462]